MKSLLTRIDQKITIKMFTYGALLMGLFMLVVLPLEASMYASRTGNANMPDSRLFYDAKWLFALAEILGQSGRRYYVISRLRFDILWPLTYGFFLITSLSLTWSFSKIKPYLFIMPLLGVVCDLLENTMVSIVFIAYPTELGVVAHMSGFMTFFKWLFIALTILMIVLGLMIKSFSMIHNKHQHTS